MRTVRVAYLSEGLSVNRGKPARIKQSRNSRACLPNSGTDRRISSDHLHRYQERRHIVGEKHTVLYESVFTRSRICCQEARSLSSLGKLINRSFIDLSFPCPVLRILSKSTTQLNFYLSS